MSGPLIRPPRDPGRDFWRKAGYLVEDAIGVILGTALVLCIVAAVLLIIFGILYAAIHQFVSLVS